MILSIGTTDHSGGLHTLTQQYMESFSNTDADVTWILFGSSPHAPDFDRGAKCNYVYLQEPWLYYESRQHLSEGVFSKINQIVDSNKFDLLFQPLQFSFHPYISDIKIPTLKSCHLLFSELIASTERFYKTNSQKSNSADHVRLAHEINYYGNVESLVINSHTSLAGLKKHYPHALTAPHLVSPPGAHSDFFIEQPIQKIKKALYFGRLNSQKNINSMQNSPPPSDWDLSIIGDDPSNKFDFEHQNITRLPWQNRKEIINQLRGHMICLFPSHYEPWGLSLNESLAAGRVCVAQVGAGGHEEQIKNGENGFLIDFNNPTFWEQINEISNLSTHKLSQISNRARFTARKWDTHFTELRQFMEKNLL